MEPFSASRGRRSPCGAKMQALITTLTIHFIRNPCKFTQLSNQLINGRRAVEKQHADKGHELQLMFRLVRVVRKRLIFHAKQTKKIVYTGYWEKTRNIQCVKGLQAETPC